MSIETNGWDLSLEAWDSDWEETVPKGKRQFANGQKAWYKGWIYGHSGFVPGGAKSYYRPVRVVKHLFNYYQIERSNGKRQWISWKNLYPIEGE